MQGDSRAAGVLTRLVDAAVTDGRQALSEPESKQLLQGLGVAVPRGVVVEDEHFATPALAQCQPPYAVKIVSPDALHKSDGGGVKLGLQTADDVRNAIAAMRQAYQGTRITGFLVEEMAGRGVELIVGANTDPAFGASILVGAGGVLAELWQDVAVRVCPITRQDAEAMLASLKAAPLLDGFRGAPSVDREAIIDIMLAIGGADGLMVRHGEHIASLDLNPIIAGADGAVAVDARILLTPAAQAAPPVAMPAPDSQVLQSLFQPRSIAVVGASSDGRGPGNSFIRNVRQFGFAGRLHVVHPKAAEIDGIAAVPSLADLPEKVDYAYIAVAASVIPGLLAKAAGKVAVAQVMSSGFAETEGGAALQEALVRGAREGGVRVLGPNCLGTHAGRAGMTFVDSLENLPGGFSVISQSGGMGVDILRRGQARGLRFANLATLGNAADISVGEILAWLLADDDTTCIGMYLENVRDGREVFELLKRNRARKPVVILKGGVSSQGQRAAQSHTGALASDHRIWQGLSRQTGVLLVDTLDGFLDTALALQCLPARDGAEGLGNIALFGNGGGTSVVACDTFARMGLKVLPFAEATLAKLEALELPPGASVLNPIDTPAGVLSKGEGSLAEQILRIAYDSPGVDAFVLHLNLPVIVGYYDERLMRNLVDAAVRVRGASQRQVHFVMVLRSDGSQHIDDMRRVFRGQALAAGIPVYDEMPDAAYALARINQLERFRSTTRNH